MKTLKNNNVRNLLKTIIRWTAVITLQDLVVVIIVLFRSIYFLGFFSRSRHTYIYFYSLPKCQV